METSEIESTKIIRWQKKLLPFIIGMVIFFSLFFFIASVAQLYYLNQRIEQGPASDLKTSLENLHKDELNDIIQKYPSYSVWYSLVILEENALRSRYHQANVLLMSRIWIKYLGFVTGMILALLGATFIIGKLREPSSTIDASNTLWKFTITSTSPGIILAVLGTTLMITTMVIQHEIEVKDVPVYTQGSFKLPSMTESTDQNSQKDNGDTVEIDELFNKIEEKLKGKGSESIK